VQQPAGFRPTAADRQLRQLAFHPGIGGALQALSLSTPVSTYRQGLARKAIT
jgi:hypothetical protein